MIGILCLFGASLIIGIAAMISLKEDPLKDHWFLMAFFSIIIFVASIIIGLGVEFIRTLPKIILALGVSSVPVAIALSILMVSGTLCLRAGARRYLLPNKSSDDFITIEPPKRKLLLDPRKLIGRGD